MRIIELFIPVFALVGVGYALRKTSFVSPTFPRQLNRIVFYCALPALLFRRVAGMAVEWDLFWNSFVTYTVAMCAVAALAALAARREPKSVGAVVVQSAFRSNLAYLGLPVVLLIFGDAVLPLAIATVSVGIVLNALWAVVVLQVFYAADDSVGIVARLTEVVKNPLVVGTVLGLIVSVTALPVPRALLAAVDLMGQMSLPAVLLVVGLSMSFTNMRARLGLAMLATVAKLLVMPAIAYGVVRFALRLDTMSVAAFTILCATPTATTAHTYVSALGGDEGFQAATISLSTAAAMVALPVWALVLGV